MKTKVNRHQQVIQHIISGLSEETHVHKNIVSHFYRALLSWNDPKFAIPMARRLEDMHFLTNTTAFRSLEKNPDVYSLGWLNHHTGQRKLFFGLLECVLETLERFDCQDKDIFVVYAGASGKASSLLTLMFPRIKILLFDPDRKTTEVIARDMLTRTHFQVFRERLSEAQCKDEIDWQDPQVNMYVCTEKSGWFDDETAVLVRDAIFPLTKRTRMLFISDIRSSAQERDIVHDMKHQLRWTILLQADMYMHKFRLPYNTSLYAAYHDLEYLSHVPFQLPTSAKEEASPTILYLEGDLCVQSHAPQMSAELRLIGMPKTKKDSRVYTLRPYDVRAIEDKMAIFNLVYRSHAQFVHENNARGTYEYLVDKMIIRRYVMYLARTTKQDTDPNDAFRDFWKIVNKYFAMHASSIVQRHFYDHLRQVYQAERGDSVPRFLQNMFYL